MELSESLRLRTKKLIKEKDLNAHKLALLCGLDRTTINKFLNGDYNASIKTIALICQALDIELKTFFDDDIFKNVEIDD